MWVTSPVCFWVPKAAERGSSRRRCPGAALRRMFFVYPPPFPAFGRGERSYICQSVAVPAAGAAGDLRQRAISPTAQRRALQHSAEHVSRSLAPRAAPVATSASGTRSEGWAGFSLGQEPAGQWSCCSHRLRRFLGATSKSRRLSRRHGAG